MSNLPFGFPFGVALGPKIFELLTVVVNSRSVNLPSVLQTFLSQILPSWVMLDNIFD